MALYAFRRIALLCVLLALRVNAQLAAQQIPLGDLTSNTTTTTSSAECESACSSLTVHLGPDKVFTYPSIPTELLTDAGGYFSAQQQEVRPTCYVLPTSASDVSTAVNTIRDHECIFAVKSGGHAQFAGGSSAPSGITLDLRYLNGLSLKDSDGVTTAQVGTGNRWGNVYDFMSSKNITVVGGRDSQVGVGGLLLGGGISFISRRYGWACDNVRNYEVVLANGSIAQISQSTNPDLYWALRGGGNNFGIVTRFDLETFPSTPIWGGTAVFMLSDIKATLARLGLSRSFALTKSSIISSAVGLINTLVCKVGYCTSIPQFASLFSQLAVDAEKDHYAQGYGFIFMLPQIKTYLAGVHIHHGQALEAETAPAYKAFRDMKKVFGTLRVSNTSDFTKEITANSPRGMRQTYATASFRISSSFLTSCMEIYLTEIEPLREAEGMLPSLVIQVISKAEISKMTKNGGNALGLKEVDGPLLLLSNAIMWKDPKDDEAIMHASKNIIDRAVALGKELGVHHPFIYQNYASEWQEVFEGYPDENRKRLREIQERYDPEGVFSKKQPGYFKV